MAVIGTACIQGRLNAHSVDVAESRAGCAFVVDGPTPGGDCTGHQCRLQGEKGEKGEFGSTGEKGERRVNKEIKGEIGFTGEKGEKGDKGEKGEEGLRIATSSTTIAISPRPASRD